MSRSRKKEPVYKDPNNTQGKRIANRKLRRKTRQSIHQEDEVLPLHKEVENSRNFLDFTQNEYQSRNKDDISRMKHK